MILLEVLAAISSSVWYALVVEMIVEHLGEHRSNKLGNDVRVCMWGIVAGLLIGIRSRWGWP